MRRRFTQRPPDQAKIVWSNELDKYILKTPFNKVYIEDLKNDLDFRISPRYNGLLKCWMVDEVDIEPAKRIVEKHFGPFIFEAKIGANQGFTNQASANGYNYFKQLFELAGPELANKFKNQILLKIHPDIGGSNDDASAANTAWDKIKSEMNWR